MLTGHFRCFISKCHACPSSWTKPRVFNTRSLVCRERCRGGERVVTQVLNEAASFLSKRTQSFVTVPDSSFQDSPFHVFVRICVVLLPGAVPHNSGSISLLGSVCWQRVLVRFNVNCVRNVLENHERFELLLNQQRERWKCSEGWVGIDAGPFWVPRRPLDTAVLEFASTPPETVTDQRLCTVLTVFLLMPSSVRWRKM